MRCRACTGTSCSRVEPEPQSPSIVGAVDIVGRPDFVWYAYDTVRPQVIEKAAYGDVDAVAVGSDNVPERGNVVQRRDGLFPPTRIDQCRGDTLARRQRPTQPRDAQGTAGTIAGEHHHLLDISRNECKPGDQCGTRAPAGRILARPKHSRAQRALRSDNDEWIGILRGARTDNVEQRPTLIVPQQELVGAETSGLAAGDDDGG
jgi:hypothetical protein